MKILYFHINGSGTPFFFEERKYDNGIVSYGNLYWPENPPADFESKWREISLIYHTHTNPIDNRFPSLWDDSFCKLFNEKARSFYYLSKSVLKDFELVDRFDEISMDKKLFDYRKDPIKYHLGFNKSFEDNNSFLEYLDNHKEVFSRLVRDELYYYKGFDISHAEYKAFNRVFLSFGYYQNFAIEFCPFSNRTFLAIMNLGGHWPSFRAMRIKREDIIGNPDKILKHFNNYLYE